MSTQGKVYSLINMKGGVGKTTLAVALAWELAKQGSKVLLVDIDPQFNATQWLVTTDEYVAWIKAKKTVANIFMPDAPAIGLSGAKSKHTPAALANTVMSVKHGSTTLDLIPSTLELMNLDAAPRGTENRLKAFLDTARKKYDFIFIDCPPTTSLFSYAAHIASDGYLVPIKPDPLSVLGLPLLERAIEEYESRSGHSIRRVGMVFTLVRATDAMANTQTQLRDEHADVFAAELRQTTGIAEAVEANQPLQVFHKTKTAMRSTLEELAAEFLSNAV